MANAGCSCKLEPVDEFRGNYTGDFDGVGLRTNVKQDRSETSNSGSPGDDFRRSRSRERPASRGVFWNDENRDYYGRDVRERRPEVKRNLIANEFLDNYDQFKPGDNITRFFPQPGDIMVTRIARKGDSISPGGYATFYKDSSFFLYGPEARELRPNVFLFRSGDFIVRLGKFDSNWSWSPTPVTEFFLCDLNHVRPWWLVGRTNNNDLQPPDLQFDRSNICINGVDAQFSPRIGDLVVRVVPGEHSWRVYWWNHYLNVFPCDLILRVGYEVRANGTCMVVNLYYREPDDRSWSFRGRDVFTFPFTSLPDL